MADQERERLTVLGALDRLTGFAYGRARGKKSEDAVGHWSDVIRAALLRSQDAPRCGVCGCKPARAYGLNVPGWLCPHDYICEGCADTGEGAEYVIRQSGEEASNG